MGFQPLIASGFTIGSNSGGGGGGVTSVNGVTGAVTLVPGTNITLSQAGGNITINSTGGGGSGTVTSISVVTANGLSGTVANPTTTPAITLTGALSGDITGNLNSNTLTATSNSTLITLNSLSLPGSQVSGNISGNAGNITASSNSTLSTLSALSLPYSQVTGGPVLSGFTTDGVIYAASSSTLASTGVPTNNLPLVGNGSGTPPTFQALNLSAGVTGTLGNAHGGTGQSSSFTQYGVTYAATATALATTAAGTAGQVLTSNGTSAPTFQNASSAVLFNKENITLASGDITNQYVNLAQLVTPNSLFMSVTKAAQVEGDDYILSTVGGVTRLTFNNDLATGGVSALVAGNILNIQYSY